MKRLKYQRRLDAAVHRMEVSEVYVQDALTAIWREAMKAISLRYPEATITLHLHASFYPVFRKDDFLLADVDLELPEIDYARAAAARVWTRYRVTLRSSDFAHLTARAGVLSH